MCGPHTNRPPHRAKTFSCDAGGKPVLIADGGMGHRVSSFDKCLVSSYTEFPARVDSALAA